MWTSSTIPYVSFNIERKCIGIKYWHQQKNTVVFVSHPLYFLLCTFTLYFPRFAFLLLIALETLLVKEFTLKFTLKEVLLKCRQTN